MTDIAIDFETDTFPLPPPVLPVQATLVDALRQRTSSRSFSRNPLSAEQISALLWAAFGINRPSSHGRTAPLAHNWQEMDIYVVLAQGSFRYDALCHRLNLVKAEDLRAITGTQDFVGSAPLSLVYVADFAKATPASPEERHFLVGADAGCIAQNVYLYCTSVGLATVVRGLVDRQLLATRLGLKPTQRITLAQSVGLPALQ
ncbi:MAG: SagB/ThcOx family dehydrogenase [Hydrogenophaga sp.]|nr:SagB/ThcOx family dehydrogenase [Hydrogenophaga sp.]